MYREDTIHLIDGIIMNQSLVTVIMALYNAEPYLHRCLNSLQAQTLGDFNVIVVDDGSTDGSLNIALDYSLQDKRFHVYHKENGGVSSARQYGIELLEKIGGKYSIHVDPDDWVEPQMFERMCKKAEGTGADMVICDYFCDSKTRQTVKRQDPRSEDPIYVRNALFQGLHGSLCNKLIRSACYKEAGIKFPDGLNYCEDFYVNISLLQESIRKVVYLPEAFYHYDNYSNKQAETRKKDCQYVNNTRMEIIKRCREIVPDSEQSWQFHMFEARMAFGIIVRGNLAKEEFKFFFRKIPISLLLHIGCYRYPILLTLLVVHTSLSPNLVSDFFRNYLSFRHFCANLLVSNGIYSK